MTLRSVAIGTVSGDLRVATSALLTTTMPAMKMTIEAVRKSGMPHNIKIMIGGAPNTEQCAKQIGADGYSARPAGRRGRRRAAAHGLIFAAGCTFERSIRMDELPWLLKV